MQIKSTFGCLVSFCDSVALRVVEAETSKLKRANKNQSDDLICKSLSFKSAGRQTPACILADFTCRIET